MNIQDYNYESNQITLTLSKTEFDMLMVLRYAAGNYIMPVKQDSDLDLAIKELHKINHHLTQLIIDERTRSTKNKP